MKKVLHGILIIVLLTTVLISTNCKKSEQPEPAKKEENTRKVPTEPAPVPEGTPKY